MLSHREKVRIGESFYYAALQMKRREEAGDEYRDDGFFDDQPQGRKKAEEAFEGVLLAASREYEERKVEFMGYLFANIAFEREVDGFLANRLTRIAQELSWTQYVLLSIVGLKDEHDLPYIQVGSTATTEGWNTYGARRELADLGYAKQDLIVGKAIEHGQLLATYDYSLPAHSLSAGGSLLFQMASLELVPKDDREFVISKLGTAETVDVCETNTL